MSTAHLPAPDEAACSYYTLIKEAAVRARVNEALIIVAHGVDPTSENTLVDKLLDQVDRIQTDQDRELLLDAGSFDHGRTIKRYPEDELLQALANIMEHPRARAVFNQRKAWVEPVFSVLR